MNPKKNEERLARLVPIKQGKGEVIGEVISIEEFDWKRNPEWHYYKMTIEDFKGYRVYGTVPEIYLEENIAVGDFVKFNAKLYPRELGFGIFRYPRPRKNSLTKGKHKKERPVVTTKAEKKAKVQRELMNFLST
jgi:hypothetical protein